MKNNTQNRRSSCNVSCADQIAGASTNDNAWGFSLPFSEKKNWILDWIGSLENEIIKENKKC